MWDSCSTEVDNLDLETITNHDVIHAMIECGNLVPEVNTGGRYTIVDKDGIKTYPDDVKTLSQLGFCDGDDVS